MKTSLRKKVICLLTTVLLGGVASAQNVGVKPKQVDQAVISDPQLIEIFRKGQLLRLDMPIDSLVFIDITRDGFGLGDVMIVYPGEKVYSLTEVEEREAAVMKDWTFPENRSFTSSALQVADYAATLESPFASILAQIVKTVEYYYSGDYIEGYFRVNNADDVVSLTLWNFNDKALEYKEGGPGGTADTLKAFDLLKVMIHDTVFVADTTLFDAIYIVKTITDTVYVPVEITPRNGAKTPGDGIKGEMQPDSADTENAPASYFFRTKPPDSSRVQPPDRRENGTGEQP